MINLKFILEYVEDDSLRFMDYNTYYALKVLKEEQDVVVKSKFVTKVIKTIKNSKYGYTLKDVEIGHECDKLIPARWAYTPNGDWIGDSKTALMLCKKFGIAPEKKNPTCNICSIGYSDKNKKWYGWSHRAIFGFGVGDKVRSGKHPDGKPKYRTVPNMGNAKQSAIRFANSVS